MVDGRCMDYFGYLDTLISPTFIWDEIKGAFTIIRDVSTTVYNMAL